MGTLRSGRSGEKWDVKKLSIIPAQPQRKLVGYYVELGEANLTDTNVLKKALSVRAGRLQTN